MHFLARFGPIAAILLTLFVPAMPQIGITSLGPSGAYTQNFDFLTSVDFLLIDNVTQQGIYAFRASVAPPGPNTFTADTGTNNTGQFKNYGAAGNGERAMGSLASGTSGSLQYGLRFVNNTGSVVTSVQVQYTGEQWRTANTNSQTLGFAYRQAATVTDLTSGTYTGVPALNFVSPVNTTPAAALNGNDPLNRVALNVTFAVNIPVGEEIMIRWIDNDDAGADHGLAIDDLTVVFRAGVTAAEVSLSGQVKAASGQGLPRTRLILSGGNLTEPRTAITNAFGYYSFEGLDAGQTYVVTVRSKQYRFSQQSIVVNTGDDVADVDFVADP